MYIKSGDTLRISFWWSHPGDKGAQWAMGHPLAGEHAVGGLTTERVGKSGECAADEVTSEGDFACGDLSTAYWWYYADITNEGSLGVKFQLDVGGVG